MLSNINLLTLLQKKLLDNKIDAIITIGSKVILELEDMETKTIIAVVSGNNLEDAYANMLAALANNIKYNKTNERLSVLW